MESGGGTVGSRVPTISVLLPTRKRREMFLRLYNSAMSLANHPGLVEVVYYVDEDDDSYDGLNLYNATRISGPRVVLSEMWNACYEAATGDIFMHCGDDIVFRTEGWDDVIRSTFAEYPDGIAFVYGNDGNGESEKNQFGTHGFVHRNWVDTVGYFVPPYFVSDYNDTFLNDMAKKVGRHRFVDILTEHMHYSLGKSEMDENTKERLERHEKERPQDLYNSQEFKDEMERKREALMEFINAFN